jgi:hypothetical protein
MKKIFVALALLLACVAFVSCRDPVFTKTDAVAEGQASERNISVAAEFQRKKFMSPLEYRLTVGSPEADGIVGATVTLGKLSFPVRIEHEQNKCVICWEVQGGWHPRKVYHVTLSFDEGGGFAVYVQTRHSFFGRALEVLAAAADAFS